MELSLDVETHFQTFRHFKYDDWYSVSSSQQHKHQYHFMHQLAKYMSGSQPLVLLDCMLHAHSTRTTHKPQSPAHAFEQFSVRTKSTLVALWQNLRQALVDMYRTCWTDRKRTMHHVFNLSSVNVWTNLTLMRTTELKLLRTNRRRMCDIN